MMKRKIALLGVAALTSFSALAYVYDYQLLWVDWCPDNPGCNMAFNNVAYTFDNWIVGSGPRWGDLCTVYRDGVLIATITTSATTYFTDYDVVPGVTYAYEIQSIAGECAATISGEFTCVYIYGADLSRRELAFDAAGGESAKKSVSASLFKQSATAKTSVSFIGATVGSSDNWIKASIVDGGLAVWVTPNDSDEAREGTVTLSYKGYSWPIKVAQAGKSSVTSYSSWAAAIGLDGAWDAKDASGIYNVFRYAFGVPTGDFTETPLIDLTFKDGKPIVKTPPVVNSHGFDIWVVSSDKADGTGNAVAYPLDVSGETVIKDGEKPARFFRLKVEIAQ